MFYIQSPLWIAIQCVLEILFTLLLAVIARIVLYVWDWIDNKKEK